MNLDWRFHEDCDCWIAWSGSLEMVVSSEWDGWAWDIYGESGRPMRGGVSETLEDAMTQCEVAACCVLI
jgi:hypothetical protein